MKKRLHLSFAVCCILALGAFLTAPVVGQKADDETTIVVTGSTTVEPIAVAFAEYYMEKNSDVKIVVNAGGSSAGAKALIDGTCDVADMSRFMKEVEFNQAVEAGVLPVAHAVAMDGLAVILHPTNPVSEITMQQLHDIYAGTISNWSELGGPDAGIVLIGRDTSSGTYETFEGLVMGGDKVSPKVEVKAHNGEVRDRVRTTPAGIGYVGLGFVDDVKAIPVDGVAATNETIVTGEYPIARPLFMWTNGYPDLGTHLHRFVTLYLTEKGQDLVEAKEFVPMTRYF